MTGICVYYRIREILQCIAVSCYSVIYYSLQNMTEILQCVLPALYLNTAFLLMKGFNFPNIAIRTNLTNLVFLPTLKWLCNFKVQLRT